MNGNNLLLDSNIIIYLSKGLIEPDKILKDYNNFYISIITYIEVLGYDFKDKKERNLIDVLLKIFNIIPVILK